jgi:hypothetical protein
MDGTGHYQPDFQGHSTVQRNAFDSNDRSLEERMFMLNHPSADKYYYCLRVVDGRVEEIPKDENEKRLTKVRRQRERYFAITGNQVKRLNELLPKDIMAIMESDPEDGGDKKQKKKKKKKTKRPTLVGPTNASEQPAVVEEPSVPDEVSSTAAGTLLSIAASSSSKPAEAASSPTLTLGSSVPRQAKSLGTGEAEKGAWFWDDFEGVLMLEALGSCRLEGLSKRQWLVEARDREATRVNQPRDIGPRLAAKDGYRVSNDAYVLSSRRDSVSGRVQGERELVCLAAGPARRARTHSFGNDKGRLDALKLADVRESKHF